MIECRGVNLLTAKLKTMDIVQKDGKFYQMGYPVLAPTNKEAQSGDIVLNIPNNTLHIMSRREKHNNFDTIHVEGSTFYEWDKAMPAQHLYILSGEDIKGNPWCLNNSKMNPEIGLYESFNKVHELNGTLKKIIATTDKSLNINAELSKYYENGIGGAKKLPAIPNDFLEAYVEAQGKGFEEVLVEMEGYNIHNQETCREHHILGYRLKVAPGSTIRIKPFNEKRYTLNRQGLVDLVNRFLEFAVIPDGNPALIKNKVQDYFNQNY